MKKTPIHQNLNTSFVDVAALVRYLGGLQFVGSIRIELSSYEADIVFTNARTIEAREYDHIAGRTSHGKHALQRILIRAREPHGRIHVYRSAEAVAARRIGSIFVDDTIIKNARKMAGACGGAAARDSSCEFIGSGRNTANTTMLQALSEVLYTIDESLAQANLSFAAAFRLTCDAISQDYPFLRMNRRALVYQKGSVFLNATADAETVASAVFAALRPIFRRLRDDQKYDGLFYRLANDLRRSSAQNRVIYLQLGLIKYLDELLSAYE